jgi:hypothetical protein
MNFDVLGFTLDIIGKILIAFTALMVHHRFRKEHKVDAKVFRAMHREQALAMLGIVLMVAGYVLQLPGKL